MKILFYLISLEHCSVPLWTICTLHMVILEMIISNYPLCTTVLILTFLHRLWASLGPKYASTTSVIQVASGWLLGDAWNYWLN